MKSHDYHLHEHLPKSIDTQNVREPAEAICRQLHKINPDILLLYDDVDELPSELLDHLAVLCHTDNYDSGFPLDVKRNLVKNSILVHKHKGTKLAVETHVSGIFGTAKVEEWYQYKGRPFTFRMTVEGINTFLEDRGVDKLLEAINSSKNERSHLDGGEESSIVLRWPENMDLPIGMAFPITQNRRVEVAPLKGEEPVPLGVGFLADDTWKFLHHALPRGFPEGQFLNLQHSALFPRHIEAPHEPIKLRELKNETATAYHAEWVIFPRHGIRTVLPEHEKKNLLEGLALPKTIIRNIRAATPTCGGSGFSFALLHSCMQIRHVDAKREAFDFVAAPVHRESRMAIGTILGYPTDRSVSTAMPKGAEREGFVGLHAGEVLPHHIRAKRAMTSPL